MRKITLSLIATSIGICLQLAALAQNDTSRMDAGAITFKREFTQNIRIRGEDLEKMHFANLGEAINAWFYGGYTSPGNLVYVVDGNVLSDINAYSVYDIEEVVMVQQAAAMIQTASSQQQLILVTTRKGSKGKAGIRAAAQTGLVNQSGSSSNLYHQAYLGAYRNQGNINMGLSADYLRDVFPVLQSDGVKTITPFNLDRLRLHGYLSWQLDTHNTVELHVNYAPQWLDQADTGPSLGSIYRNEGRSRQHVFMPWARWHSHLLSWLKNDLQAGYGSTQTKMDVSSIDLHPSNSVPNSQQAKGNAHADHLFLRDRLGASFTAGEWTFAPSLNISYEHVNKRANQTYVSYNGGGLYNTTTSTNWYKQGLVYLTPAVELSYRSLLHIHGGVLQDLSDYHGGKPPHRNFPFAGLAVDLLHPSAHGQAARSRLQLFGSYAKTAPSNGSDYPLNDLSGSSNAFYAIQESVLTGIYSPTTLFPPGKPQTDFWNWGTGARLTLPGDRLALSYHFERRNFLTLAVIPIPQAPNGIAYVYAFPEWKSSLHSLSLQWKVFDHQGLRWQTGLNGTIITSKTFIGPGETFVQPVGDYNTDHPSVTGGWVNRFEWKNVLVGADLLYHFSEQVMLDPSPGSTERVNSFQVQHVYAGYRLQLSKDRPLELYFNSRSPYQNSRSTLADRRRYFGVGGKLTI